MLDPTKVKIFTFLGLLVILAGILPYIQGYVPEYIPVEGTGYQILIVILGALMVFLGLKKAR